MKQIPRNSRWGFWTAVGRLIRSTAGYIKNETLSGRSTDKTRELGSSSRLTVSRPQGLSVDWPGRPIDLHRRARPRPQGPVDRPVNRSGLK